MAALILSILGTLRSALRTRADLTIENLALRPQSANLRCTSGRPLLRNSDRAFWAVLSRLWSRWAEVPVVVRPAPWSTTRGWRELEAPERLHNTHLAIIVADSRLHHFRQLDDTALVHPQFEVKPAVLTRVLLSALGVAPQQ